MIPAKGGSKWKPSREVAADDNKKQKVPNANADLAVLSGTEVAAAAEVELEMEVSSYSAKEIYLGGYQGPEGQEFAYTLVVFWRKTVFGSIVVL